MQLFGARRGMQAAGPRRLRRYRLFFSSKIESDPNLLACPLSLARLLRLRGGCRLSDDELFLCGTDCLRDEVDWYNGGKA